MRPPVHPRTRHAGARLAVAALVALIAGLCAPEAAAADRGAATVRVGSGSGSGLQHPIPAGATEFETPAVQLARVSGFPNQPPFYRGTGRAIAGIYIPDGAVYGAISTFVRNEAPNAGGSDPKVFAGATVEYEDIFDVLSDTLPQGTLVDVTVDLRIRFRGSAGATGQGSCCWVASTYDVAFMGQGLGGGGLPYSPGMDWPGILAGGIDGDPIELRFDPYRVQAFVGEQFWLRLQFRIESWASAVAAWDPDSHRYVPGQADTAGTAAVFFATTVTPAASFAAAAGAPAAAYLRSAAGGFVLPGAEAFDAANLDAHLLPLVPVPEPTMAALFALGLVALGARALVRHPIRSARGRLPVSAATIDPISPGRRLS